MPDLLSFGWFKNIKHLSFRIQNPCSVLSIIEHALQTLSTLFAEDCTSTTQSRQQQQHSCGAENLVTWHGVGEGISASHGPGLTSGTYDEPRNTLLRPAVPDSKSVDLNLSLLLGHTGNISHFHHWIIWEQTLGKARPYIIQRVARLCPPPRCHRQPVQTSPPLYRNAVDLWPSCFAWHTVWGGVARQMIIR